jgi:hypothetical protein
MMATSRRVAVPLASDHTLLWMVSKTFVWKKKKKKKKKTSTAEWFGATTNNYEPPPGRGDGGMAVAVVRAEKEEETESSDPTPASATTEDRMPFGNEPDTEKGVLVAEEKGDDEAIAIVEQPTTRSSYIKGNCTPCPEYRWCSTITRLCRNQYLAVAPVQKRKKGNSDRILWNPVFKLI